MSAGNLFTLPASDTLIIDKFKKKSSISIVKTLKDGVNSTSKSGVAEIIYDALDVTPRNGSLIS